MDCFAAIPVQGVLLLNACLILICSPSLARYHILRPVFIALLLWYLNDWFNVVSGSWRPSLPTTIGMSFLVWLFHLITSLAKAFIFGHVAENNHGHDFGKFRPLLFFCSTLHSRFVPTKHTFKYPILYVGFPVTLKGAVGGLFGVVKAESEKTAGATAAAASSTVFSVDPASYLNPKLPFDQKLHSLLLRHGINPCLYPHTYFVTTPRFLGYSFNPVSYYYLYDSHQVLKLVILEVNNTFGETHHYLLNADNPANPPARKGYTFAGDMEKVFHISPFNHRSGNYNIQVKDPLDESSGLASRMDMHMIVYARNGIKTMVARAFSTSASYDLMQGSWMAGLKIALSWGYNNFLALPETFYEAWQVYRKETAVYTRPVPLSGSGQRKATQSESEMQDLWLQNFQHWVMKYPHPLTATVTLPHPNPMEAAQNITFRSSCAPSSSSSVADHEKRPPPDCSLTVLVKTPRFFRRFFSHGGERQTMCLDFSCQPQEHRPAVINDHDLFLSVLKPDISDYHNAASPSSWFWGQISRVREWKSMKEVTRLLLQSGHHQKDVESVREHAGSLAELSSNSLKNNMDHFFLTSPDVQLRQKYHVNTLRALLTDLLAGGESETLELYESAVKFAYMLLLLGTSVFLAMQPSTSSDVVDKAHQEIYFLGSARSSWIGNSTICTRADDGSPETASQLQWSWWFMSAAFIINAPWALVAAVGRAT